MSFVGSAALAKILEDRGEGVFVTQVMPLPNGGTALAERYRDALKSLALGEDPSFVSLEGYLAGRLALAGLETCGPQPTRECFLEAIRNLGAAGIDGFQLDYGPEDYQGSDAVFITAMNAEGQFREVKELPDKPRRSPNRAEGKVSFEFHHSPGPGWNRSASQ